MAFKSQSSQQGSILVALMLVLAVGLGVAAMRDRLGNAAARLTSQRILEVNERGIDSTLTLASSLLRPSNVSGSPYLIPVPLACYDSQSTPPGFISDWFSWFNQSGKTLPPVIATQVPANAPWTAFVSRGGGLTLAVTVPYVSTGETNEQLSYLFASGARDHTSLQAMQSAASLGQMQDMLTAASPGGKTQNVDVVAALDRVLCDPSPPPNGPQLPVELEWTVAVAANPKVGQISPGASRNGSRRRVRMPVPAGAALPAPACTIVGPGYAVPDGKTNYTYQVQISGGASGLALGANDPTIKSRLLDLAPAPPTGQEEPFFFLQLPADPTLTATLNVTFSSAVVAPAVATLNLSVFDLAGQSHACSFRTATKTVALTAQPPKPPSCSIKTDTSWYPGCIVAWTTEVVDGVPAKQPYLSDIRCDTTCGDTFTLYGYAYDPQDGDSATCSVGPLTVDQAMFPGGCRPPSSTPLGIAATSTVAPPVKPQQPGQKPPPRPPPPTGNAGVLSWVTEVNGDIVHD